MCKAIEAMLDQSAPRRATAGITVKDIRPAHFAAVKRLVDFKRIAKSRLRFAHDAMFGVGAGCFAELLAGT
jgi:hypothetical protein